MTSISYQSDEFSFRVFLTDVKIAFSADYYGSAYADIGKFVGNDNYTEWAWNHFCRHGIFEGRCIAKIGSRNGLRIFLAEAEGSKIEIGPFLAPFLKGKDVKYFDVLDHQGLIKRASEIGYPKGDLPQIHYVHENGDLSIVDQKFDYAVSSHCIEHQPNLIEHLNKVSDILTENGQYYILCPDKRVCFDYFNYETRLLDVIAANLEQRKVHPLRSVLEHRMFITHNYAGKHWSGDHGAVLSGQVKYDVLRRAIAEYESGDGSYIDVHSWIFTPLNFSQIIKELDDMGLIKMRLAEIYPTVMGSNEFIAVLENKNKLR